MHNEKRGSKTKEAFITMISGCAFGGTNTIVGHPFDTIKTKMQVQAGYKESYINSIK